MNTFINDLCYMVLVYFILFILSMVVITAANAQSVSEIESVITRAALENGVSPDLALAIAEVESQFNPKAVGSMGEIGIFQLRPEFHAVVAGNIEHNADVATKYLAKLSRQCRRYGDAYFVCFNYGPNNQRLRSPELSAYYRKVKAAQRRRQRTVNVVATTD